MKPTTHQGAHQPYPAPTRHCAHNRLNPARSQANKHRAARGNQPTTRPHIQTHARTNSTIRTTNENTTNNAITLNQNSTPEEYAKILRGRHITNNTISDDEIRATTLELDNGDTLTIEGNEGRMGYVNRWHHLKNAHKRGNHTTRIMNAHVEHNQDDNYADGYEIYTIFATIDENQTQLPPAILHGDDGPGAHGTGSTPTARRGATTRA